MENQLFLNRNEYFFTHHPDVISCSLETNNLSVYPTEGMHLNLKNKIASILDINPSMIFLSHGAEDVLLKLLILLRSSRNHLILEDFSWNTYLHMVDGLGYNIHYIKTKKLSQEFLFNTTEFTKKISSLFNEPSVILLTSPNNPTGHLIDIDYLQQIIQQFPQHKFILDCVYAEFANIYFKQLHKFTNVFLIGSFSKYFGLPGLRVGFVIGSLAKFFELRLGLATHSIQICQAALNHIDWYDDHRKATHYSLKKFLNYKFNKIKLFNSQAPFLLAEVSEYSYTDLKRTEEFTRIVPKYLTHDHCSYIRFGLGESFVFKKIHEYLSLLSSF